MTVTYVRHTGPCKGNAKLFGQLYGKLMQWAGPRGLLEQKEASCMSVYHDDPQKKHIIDICVPVKPL